MRLAVVLLIGIGASAQGVRVVKFSDAIKFNMGRMEANRIVHPDMGAKLITLNMSMSADGSEFPQHVHQQSDDTILVLKGRVHLRQGDSLRVMHAGEAAWVPTPQIHGTITLETMTTMISFQTPPDFALYTGGRDPSKGATIPPEGRVTPGAVRYVNFGGKNGWFLSPSMGHSRISAAHRVLQPGERFTVRNAAGGEQVLFVWKGQVSIGDQAAGERDAVFVNSETTFDVVSRGSTDAVVIQAITGSSLQLTGRWNAQEAGKERGKVFWLEVDPDGLSGRFLGGTLGRTAPIQDARIENGELKFRVERKTDTALVSSTVSVQPHAGAIEGSTQTGDRVWFWRGWRPPVMEDWDDGTWIPAKPSTTTWRTQRPERIGDWSLQGNSIRNLSPKADLLVSTESFRNFHLHAEYKLPPGGNAGIGLRGRYEVQLADDKGQPPDLHSHGSVYSQIAPKVNASKAAGEWQAIDIALVGRDVTITLNGTRIIDRQAIRGLTGMAGDTWNPWEDKSGPITLQGDHGPIEYRHVRITPLTRR